MNHYIFYTTNLKDDILLKIETLIKEHEIAGQLEIKRNDSVYEVHYESNEDKEKNDEAWAHVMNDIMQEQAISKVCKQYLKNREDLSRIERREISEAFKKNNYLSRQEGVSYMTYYLLYLPIYNEIKEKQTLHIEGWFRFRLDKYKIILKDILEQFIEDYMAKKDVVSFIKLMRDASLLAVPLEEVMHVVYKQEGKIHLYNKNLKNVTSHYIKKYCKDLLLDSTLTKEDLLLHVLITICPKKIVMHKTENMKTKQFINTLEIIFEDNMTYCTECELCKKNE